MHAALDDLVAKREAGAAIPTLFDDVEEDDLVGDASADTGTVAKFADDFVESPVDAATLAAVHGTRARATVSPVDEPESPSRTVSGHEMFDSSEPPRQTLLPIAVALVLGLLIGFAGGYFVRSNERLAPTPVESSMGAERRPAAAALPGGAATSDKPGQYSEQKVTPPAATPPAPRTAAPPVPNETARATPRTPPVPTRGTLVVKSSPSHAQVTLNGKWRGRTPLTIDDLTFGKYNVRVVQPGYRVAQQDFALTARDDEHAFTARLEPDERVIAPQRGRPPVVGGTEAAAPATYTGSLFVDSRPRGATVLVDGKSIGQTPVMVSNVAVGAHVVRIELTGKKPWTASTRVASGETARVTGSLEDKP